MSKLPGQLKSYFRFFIAFAMLGILYRSGLLQLEKIGEALRNPWIITAGLIIFSFQTLLFALRFKIINTLIHQISFRLALKLHLTGLFFNTFIPGGVGGDIVKAVELSIATQTQKRSTLALTLVDRVLGLYGLICFSFLFLLVEINILTPSHKKYLIFSAALFIIATFCIILRKKVALVFDRITQSFKNDFILNVKDSLLIFFDYLGRFLVFSKFSRFMVVSFAAQFLSVSFLYIVVNHLVDTPPSFALFFPLVCFGFVAMAIPITPGGIGFGQAAFYFIFRSLGEPVAEAAIIGISLMQLFSIIFSLPGGYFFIRSPRRPGSTSITPPTA